MSTATYGQPSIIDQAPMPPAAVNIVSSTNAAPTVITATAHGLHTGQAVIIFGHLVNTNANGIWIVTVLSADTFKISTFAGFAGPTYIAGNGVGAATGTVQSLAFPGVNLPEDAVDARDATSVNVPFEMLLDTVAWLAYQVLANMTILQGGNLQMQAESRMQNLTGSRRNVGFTDLSDADHTVTAGTDGPVYILALPTAARTITIAQASDTGLQDADYLEFWMPRPGNDPASDYYAIKREGSANNICILWGKYFPTAGAGDTYPAFCRVHLKSGVWRLSGGAGVNFDTDA